MTLWARAEKTETKHLCMFCGHGVFKSRLRVVAAIYGEGVRMPFLTPPVSFQCDKCGTIYHLQGFNE